MNASKHRIRILAAAGLALGLGFGYTAYAADEPQPHSDSIGAAITDTAVTKITRRVFWMGSRRG